MIQDTAGVDELIDKHKLIIITRLVNLVLFIHNTMLNGKNIVFISIGNHHNM